jgi:hypothetical protein
MPCVLVPRRFRSSNAAIQKDTLCSTAGHCSTLDARGP